MSEDWSTWSKVAGALMFQRNEAWRRRYDVPWETPYAWSFESAALVFDRGDDDVIARICVVGTVSESQGSFLWAWANETIPKSAIRGLERVCAFGREHGLSLLTDPEISGGLPEGKECAVIAGRILDAAGVWIEHGGDVTALFTMHDFETRSKKGRSENAR